MLTAANYAANLRTATRNAAAAAGVTGIAPGDFTLEQRQAYNQAIVRQILAYPNSFSPDTVRQAATMNTDYGRRGYNFDDALDIAGAAAAPVLGGLQSVGQGAITVLNSAKWLLPLSVIALVVIWLMNPRRPPSARA